MHTQHGFVLVRGLKEKQGVDIKAMLDATPQQLELSCGADVLQPTDIPIDFSFDVGSYFGYAKEVFLISEVCYISVVCF